MKKLFSCLVFTIVFIRCFFPCFSQTSEQSARSVLELSSPLALQTVPIYEGVDDFKAKGSLKKIVNGEKIGSYVGKKVN